MARFSVRCAVMALCLAWAGWGQATEAQHAPAQQASTQSAPTHCPGRRIAGFDKPESVFESDDAIYVSNIASAGAGYISRVDKRTLQIRDLRFLPAQGGFDKPMGLLVTGGVLYVADLKRVRGFDLKTRRAVFELDIAEARNLNDLVLGSGPREEPWFFASDYYANKVFKVYPRRKAYEAFAEVTGANGLAYDRPSRTLYVAGLGGDSSSGERPPYSGALYTLAADGTRTLLGESGTFLDGIALLRGRVYFSDWGSDLGTGRMYSVPVRGPWQVREEPLCAGVVRGPADFARGERRWLIPALLDGAILVEPVRGGD